MLHYVYYPFPKSSAIGPNATVLKRYTDKYSSSANNTHDEKTANHKGPVLRYKGDALGDLEDADMLLIASHGGRDDPDTIISDLGNKESFNTNERMSANDLAGQLSGANLRKTHILIKMLSCYATGVLQKTQDGITRNTRGENFFAKLLAMALSANFSYKQIIVGGYSGPFLNSTVASHRFSRKPIGEDATQWNRVDVEGATPVDAHDHIYWVDGSGEYVDGERVRGIKLESDKKQGIFKDPSKFQLQKGRTSVFQRT